MTVSSETIIEKMIFELEKARQFPADDIKLKVAISKVHVMCELLLEEKKGKSDSSDMMQHILKQAPVQAQDQGHVIASSNVDDEEAGSIFDF